MIYLAYQQEELYFATKYNIFIYKIGSEKVKYKDKTSTAVINITLRHVGLTIFALENK